MADRADRRRQQKRAAERYPLTLSTLIPGDPANEGRLAEMEADHARMLADPEISDELRASLQASLGRIHTARVLLAAIEAPDAERMN